MTYKGAFHFKREYGLKCTEEVMTLTESTLQKVFF